MTEPNPHAGHSGCRRSASGDKDFNVRMMKSTFLVSGRSGSHEVLGTAFTVVRPSSDRPGWGTPILVTAKHVLSGIGDEVALLHMRRQDHDGGWQRVPVPVRLRTNGSPVWTEHPDPTIDVAALAFQVPSELSCQLDLLSTKCLGSDADIERIALHPGDIVRCLGYPYGLPSSKAGFPLLRNGMIASYPVLPGAEMIIDFEVFPGNSGGPVYLAETARTIGDTFSLGTYDGIIGMVSEQMLVPDMQPSGMVGPSRCRLALAVVVPAPLIRETTDRVP